jgi:hypothetical protein
MSRQSRAERATLAQTAISKRRARLAHLDDEPGDTVPAVANLATDERANPMTGETSKEIWHRWSVERAAKERNERLREQAMAEAESERGIYAIEIARQAAQHHAQGACPEWRFLKDLLAEDFGRVLRQQPEMRQKDVKGREQIIVALFNALPAHLHGALSELRSLIELVSIARESTAFLFGYELGREAGRQGALRDPRVMLAPTPERHALPSHEPEPDQGLRLHLLKADNDG